MIINSKQPSFPLIKCEDIEIAKGSEKVWHWFMENLMTEHTQLGAGIFFMLALSACLGKPLRLQELNSLSNSPSAVRRSVNKLKRNGWLTTGSSPDDGRAKVIAPTQKFIDIYMKYIDAVKSSVIHIE